MKQAPAWNELVKEFAESDKVVFGDVNIESGDKVEVIHGTLQPAGEGGWPTIRYFNKGTGYGGAAYVQKLQMKMCEELGDLDRLRSYIAAKSQGSSNMTYIAAIGVFASLFSIGFYFLKRPLNTTNDKGKQKTKEGKKKK